MQATKQKTYASYLSSGLIKSLGESLAKKIVDKFPDPLNVILNDPLKLSEISGISDKKAMEIALSVKETLKYKNTAIELSPCALSPGALIKIYHQIKNPSDVLKNPISLPGLMA